MRYRRTRLVNLSSNTNFDSGQQVDIEYKLIRKWRLCWANCFSREIFTALLRWYILQSKIPGVTRVESISELESPSLHRWSCFIIAKGKFKIRTNTFRNFPLSAVTSVIIAEENVIRTLRYLYTLHHAKGAYLDRIRFNRRCLSLCCLHKTTIKTFEPRFIVATTVSFHRSRTSSRCSWL